MNQHLMFRTIYICWAQVPDSDCNWNMQRQEWQ